MREIHILKPIFVFFFKHFLSPKSCFLSSFDIIVYNQISTMTNNRELDLGNLTLFDYNAVKSGDTDIETV